MPVVRSVRVSRHRWILRFCSSDSKVSWNGLILDLFEQRWPVRWTDDWDVEYVRISLCFQPVLDWWVGFTEPTVSPSPQGVIKQRWTEKVLPPPLQKNVQLGTAFIPDGCSRCLGPSTIIDEQTNLIDAQTWKSELINQQNNLWMW